MDKNECWFCEKVKGLKNGNGECSYNKNLFEEEILDGPYTGVYLAYTSNDKAIFLYGCGEGRTDDLYINYCPHCGKLLNETIK